VRTGGSTTRTAFTLLEVILALAILAGSVVLTGELMRNGMLNAQAARDLTRGELVCESVMSQVVTGALSPSSVSDVPFDDDNRWLYSIAVDSGQLQGLMIVTVTVHRDAAAGQLVTPCKMVRWMIDPEYAATMSAVTTPAQGVTQ
jgi:prepilin-type N-terminal cleavage/methylation domain-containing protein